MSIDIMTRFWWREDLTTMEKFVAVALADSCFDDGETYASLARLAKKCSCSKRTIQTALRGLEGKGLVRTFHRKDRANAFQFVLSNLPHIEKPAYTPKESKFGYEETKIHRALQEAGEAEEQPGFFEAPHADTAPVQKAEKDPMQDLNLPHADSAPRTLENTLESLDVSSAVFETKTPLPIPDEKPDLVEWVEAAWHHAKRAFPGIADVRTVDKGLAENIRKRGREFAKPSEDAFDAWYALFEQIWSSRFLTGQVAPGPGRKAPFKLTLGWASTTTNFRNIVDGKYISADGEVPDVLDQRGRPLGAADAAASRTLSRIQSARERQ